MKNENKKTVVVYDSFYEAMKILSTDEARVKLFNGMMEYGLTGIEPNFETPELKLSWIFYKPNMDSNIKRYEKAIASGKKGGEAKALNQDAKRVNEVLSIKAQINDSNDTSNEVEQYTYQEEKVQPESLKDGLLELLESNKYKVKPTSYFMLQSEINNGLINEENLLIRLG